MTEKQTMNMKNFTRRAQIPHIIKELFILLQFSINKEEELEISRMNLMTLKKIEDFNI